MSEHTQTNTTEQSPDVNNAANNTAAGGIIGDDFSFGPEFISKAVPEEYRDHPEIKNAKDLPTFIKNHMNLVKKIGEKTEGLIKKPSEQSTPEEIAEYRKAMGVPESADQYQFERPQLPDGMVFDENMEKEVREVFHKLNISAEAAKELYNWYNNYELELAKQIEASSKKMVENTISELKKPENWGSDYDKNVEITKQAYNRLGLDELAKLTGFGDHPAFIKYAYNLSKVISDDVIITGDAVSKTQADKVKRDAAGKPQFSYPEKQ